MANSISIVIATSGRVDKIRRLLESISRVSGGDRIDHEIVLANNAPDEPTATAVAALADEFNERDGVRCWQVREPRPGKCRAQNKTIPLTKGSLLAFLDDDVEVVPGWLEAIDAFFETFPHDVMQGSILMRDEDQKNASFRHALNQFRTIDFLKYDFPRGTDIKTLTGGNIAVRRGVFAAVGMFDDRLGPGGHGISEDVEFAGRVIKGGKRIGWEPGAGVFNELDPSRLSEDEFRRRHEAQGRSRYAYKQSSVFTIIPNLMRSVCTLGWHSMFFDVRKKYRAKGRYFHYRAMLMEKLKSTRNHQD
ncbi:MAG: glycosyltransferase family 2 protein [Deltaproteobacteria bacterium]|nr:glycosyltransferase family 2 protein [Deltaproteobacteria bacterium]